ncbi:hypothetical protein PEC18_34235 [Paucibacter sp. O1-1]|nr:hypothetical protein [Paucibacter sp. O1-1]MDA3830750.1 hypothetical protein [Paucibacter sp. O1-1]
MPVTCLVTGSMKKCVPSTWRHSRKSVKTGGAPQHKPDLGYPLEGLIADSRFADLLVIARDTCPDEKMGQSPDFVQDIIAAAECPVMVAPITFTDIDQIVLAYDESRSSAFAVKQFSYLFPETDELKITMLHVDEGKDGNEIQREKLSHWLAAYYNCAVFETMTGKASAELYKYLHKKKRHWSSWVLMVAIHFSKLLSPKHS